jgi:hypothetical protein
MRNAVTVRNGWTTTARGDRAQNFNRNLNHGANTLIMNVPGVLTMGDGLGVYHHSVCGQCKWFPCNKNPRADTNYCLMHTNKFERKG